MKEKDWDKTLKDHREMTKECAEIQKKGERVEEVELGGE